MKKIYNAECLFDVTKTKLPPKVRTYEKSSAIIIVNWKILDQIDLLLLSGNTWNKIYN